MKDNQHERKECCGSITPHHKMDCPVYQKNFDETLKKLKALPKKSTGGQSESDISREEYPAWYAIADALNGEVYPFDVYQGPYIEIPGEGRLFIYIDDGVWDDYTRLDSQLELNGAPKQETFKVVIERRQ